jgi:transcriptional regulator GlxA family with amidase domain
MPGRWFGRNDILPSFCAVTHSVAVLLFPDFQILDAAGPIAAIEMAARGDGAPAYRVQTLAADPARARSSAGVHLSAESLADARPFDTLIVAGGQGVAQAVFCPETIGFIRAADAAGARIASVCSGAFLLAEAGLLDGGPATTHWSAADLFRRRYPAVRLDPDRIFTRQGRIWTSAGVTAGIDLTLALIAEDLGEEVSRAVARTLVVFHRRPGGQSQFSEVLRLQERTDRFSGVIAWAREHLTEPLTVEQLADRAGLSPRQFARAFAESSGVTPAKAVERLRLEAARSLVEESALAVETIAERTGFGDAERMRRAFLRAFNSPPQALRRSWRSEQDSPLIPAKAGMSGICTGAYAPSSSRMKW